MKDKRIEKIKNHFDILMNGKKYKVLSCEIQKENHRLSIKTKVFGQDFPREERVVLIIPSENTTEVFCASMLFISSTAAIEHWEYTIQQEESP